MLKVHLKPLEQDQLIELWDDTKIKAGSNWSQETEEALATAKIAILLVSARFLASDFIRTKELPHLLTAAKAKGTLILQIIVSPCLFTHAKELQEFQTVNPPEKPLSNMKKTDQEAIFVQVAKRISEALPNIKAANAPSGYGDQATKTIKPHVVDDNFREGHGQSPSEARLEELLATFRSAPAGIQQWIKDESLTIRNKTVDFVGRRFVFDAIEKFLEESRQHPSGGGYFIIQGDPGIGKTALTAQLVKNKGCVHHFNRRSVGQNTHEAFLGNVCAQLIARYDLQYSALPPQATLDGGFFDSLLKEVADRTSPDEHVLIVVDALDEVDMTRQSHGVNTLYLPDSLPPRVYFVLTRRRLEAESLRVAGRRKLVNIEHDQKENKTDIRDYLRRVVERPSIRKYILERGISADGFVSILENKSDGNFIYLYYVCLDVENGRYHDTHLAALPEGLENYYESHWRLIKNRSDGDWFEYKLPVLFVLAEAEVALSVKVISQYANKESERSRIVSVLEEWRQFLHFQDPEAPGPGDRLYSIYHASFRDFIYRKIKENHINANVFERVQSNTADFIKTFIGFDDQFDD